MSLSIDLYKNSVSEDTLFSTVFFGRRKVRDFLCEIWTGRGNSYDSFNGAKMELNYRELKWMQDLVKERESPFLYDEDLKIIDKCMRMLYNSKILVVCEW